MHANPDITLEKNADNFKGYYFQSWFAFNFSTTKDAQGNITPGSGRWETAVCTVRYAWDSAEDVPPTPAPVNKCGAPEAASTTTEATTTEAATAEATTEETTETAGAGESEGRRLKSKIVKRTVIR